MAAKTLFGFAALAVAALSAGGAAAQPVEQPPIAAINFYGLRTLDEARVREALPFRIGDVLCEQPETDAIAAEIGAAHVEFAGICCADDGGLLVFIGVAEDEIPAPTYRPEPTGEIRLPDGVVASYDAWTQALIEAVRTGQAGEDHSEGHALSVHPGMRAEQERFIAFAARDRDLLVEVLEQSSDFKHRGVAAHMLGYVADKSAVVDALSRAMLDSHELVRNNATRALGVMADYASRTPDAGIVIDPEPYVAMLDSIVWSDRNKATMLLGFLSASRDPALMAELRERSMPALIEMCTWEGSSHGQPSCLMLQRVLSLPDDASPEAAAPTVAAAAALLAEGSEEASP